MRQCVNFGRAVVSIQGRISCERLEDFLDFLHWRLEEME